MKQKLFYAGENFEHRKDNQIIKLNLLTTLLLLSSHVFLFMNNNTSLIINQINHKAKIVFSCFYKVWLSNVVCFAICFTFSRHIRKWNGVCEWEVRIAVEDWPAACAHVDRCRWHVKSEMLIFVFFEVTSFFLVWLINLYLLYFKGNLDNMILIIEIACHRIKS